MIIKEVQLRNYAYKSRKGLAERQIQKYLERQGYEVFRGTMILGQSHSYYYYRYSNVKQKYDRLEILLISRCDLNQLRKSIAWKGIPDFFAHRKTDNKTMFVEVKLEHEQLSKAQFEQIRILESFGFNVVVIRLKQKIYREETAVDVENKKCVITIRQEKLWKRWEKR